MDRKKNIQKNRWVIKQTQTAGEKQGRVIKDLRGTDEKIFQGHTKQESDGTKNL